MKSFIKLRPLLVGFALDIGLIAVGYLVEAMVGTAMAGGKLPSDAGYQVLVVMLLVLLVLPPLVAGWLAGTNGGVYGLILGALPVALASVSKSGASIVFLAVYLIVAVLGGLAGQSLARAGRPKNPQ